MTKRSSLPVVGSILWKMFAVCPVLALAMVWNARAANTVKTVNNGATDLTAAASYTAAGVPNTLIDVDFASGTTYSATTFTINSNLSVGTMDDLDATQSLIITNSGSTASILTFGNGSGNSSPGSVSTDIIYVASGGNLTFQNGTNATLTLNLTSGTVDNAGTLSLASPISLTGGFRSLTFDGAGNTTIGGAMAGAGDIAFAATGSGAVTLSGTNTYLGTSTLTSGKLNLNSAGALGNSNVFIISGGTLDNTSGGAITLASIPYTTLTSFTFGGTNALSLGSGITSGSATITMAGTANLTIPNYVTPGQALAVNGSGTTGGVYITNLLLSRPSSSAGTTLSGSGAINVNSVSNGGPTFSPLTYSGSGTLTLAGANSYTGVTNINAGGGTIVLGNALSLGPTSTAAMNFTSSADNVKLSGNNVTLVELQSDAATTATISNGSSTNAALTVNEGTAYSYFGTLANGGTGTLGLTKLGSATLTLAGGTANAYTGATTINGGTLLLNLGNLGLSGSPVNLINSASALSLGGGTLSVTGVNSAVNSAANSQTFSGTSLTGGASAIVATQGGSTSLTIALGGISRSAGATLDLTTLPTTGSITTTTTNNSAGILGGWATVTGTNWAVAGSSGTATAITALGTYTTLPTTGGNATTDNDQMTATTTLTGNVTINSLKIGTGAGPLNLGSNNLTLNGASGGLLSVLSNTISGTGILGAGATGEFIVYDGPAAATTTINAPIIGSGTSGSLTKAGLGVLALNSANSYTGGTTLDAGTLTVGNVAALGATGAGVTLYGGTLNLNTATSVNAYNVTVNNNATINSGSGASQTLGTLNIGAATLSTTTTSSTPLINFGATTLSAAGGGTSIFNPTTAGLTVTSVTGTATTGLVDNLSLNGTNANNLISGGISNGAAGGQVAVIVGTGTGGAWTIGGSSTYTGATILSGSSAALNVTGTLGNTPVFVDGGTLNLNAANAISQNVLQFGTFGGASSFLTESATNALSGTASLVLSGSSIVTATLSQANSYSGTTTLYGATLILGNAGALGTSAVTLASGTLKLRSDTSATFTDASTTVSPYQASGGTVAIDVDALTASGTRGSTLQLGPVTFDNPGLSAGGSGITVTNNSGANNYNFSLGMVTVAQQTVLNGIATSITNSMVNNTSLTGSTGGLLTIAGFTVPASNPWLQFVNITDTSATSVTSVGGITGGVGLLQLSSSGAGNLTLTGTNSNLTLVAQGSGTTTVSGASSNTSVTQSGTGSVILNGPISGTGSVTQGATGTTKLTGANTYTGNTSDNLGTMILNGGSLGGSFVSVGSGATPTAAAGNATLQVSGNYTIGTATAGTLNIRGGNTGSTPLGQGTLSLVDGTINTLTLANNAAGNTFSVGNSSTTVTGNNSILNMEVGATSDEIVVGTGISKTYIGLDGTGGATVVNLTGLGLLSGTTQTLISSPGGVDTTTNNHSTFALGFVLGATSGNFSGNTVALGSTATSLTLTETANATPANAYYNGAAAAVTAQGGTTAFNSFVNGNTDTSNFGTAAGGTGNATGLVNGTTNVVFDTNLNGTAVSTTLGQNLAINSLTFNSTGTVAIGGTNTLTINAGSSNNNTAGNGITVSTGAGNNTISAPIALGADQTWTVTDATNTLTVSNQISGAHALTLAGAGTLLLSGNNTYSGATTVSSGTLLVNGTHTGAGTYNVLGGTLGGTGNGTTSGLINTGANAINIGNGTTGGTITGGTATSVGMLTLTTTATAGVVFNGTSGSLATYLVNLNGASSSNLTINGALTLTGSNDHITVLGTPIATSYDLVNYTGALNGTFTEMMGDLPSGYQLDYTSQPGEILLDTMTSVPEPATWVLPLLLTGYAGWQFAGKRRRTSVLQAA